MRALSLLMVAALAVGLPVLPVRADVDAGLELDGGTPLEGLVHFPDGGFDLVWPDGGLDVPVPIVEGQPSPLTGLGLSLSRARLLAAERKTARDVLLKPSESAGVSVGRVALIAGGGAVVGAAVAVVVTLLVRK